MPRQGEVAFGSRASDVFMELDALRRGRPIEAYIYSSHDHRAGGGRRPLGGPPYVRWEKALVGGSHPDPERYRPPSTWSEDG